MSVTFVGIENSHTAMRLKQHVAGHPRTDAVHPLRSNYAKAVTREFPGYFKTIEKCSFLSKIFHAVQK